MEWTKASQPPAHKRDVLVCNNETGEIALGDYNKDRRIDEKWGIAGNVYFLPTHWCELPLLPDKGK